MTPTLASPMADPRFVLPLLLVACRPADTSARDAPSVAQTDQDSIATAVISPAGGTVELTGVATVNFPAGAFTAPRPVSVSTTDTPQTEEARVRWDVSVGPPQPLSYDVRINSGDVAPATSFEIVLTVPDSYVSSLPTNHSPQAFAQMVSGGAMEDLDLYEVLESEYDAVAKVIRAAVPAHATRPLRAGGTYEVIVLVGAVWR